MAQILRYSETPVGAYDELCIIPGHFSAPEKLGLKGKFMRITGIWVSQEATCRNGRELWNIPKSVGSSVASLDMGGKEGANMCE